MICEACGDDLMICCGKCIHELCTNACECKKNTGKQFTNEYNPKKKLSKDEVNEIRLLKGRGVSNLNLSIKYNVSPTTIWRIVRGYTHK